ncbi:LOW QUALITY PROTEIN: hypothetical protein FOMG_17631 [Fusarium oxysporum f. sp. melonis 26406]|uniref:Uncharacterized protein n=1 Tax=Fusarium oxysporum f. sp. melonis 26406 TaxID=1089452 RepID=W9Z2V6_FUSOX|nr:LOW QUALITY PROTEIN: hypothetical protein FOMG_17631 [Fusarium oxysporum f. sp. melonis 26406]
MSVPGYRKFCFRSARNRANNTLNPNPDDIEEVSITDQSKRRKRNSTDISRGPSALNSTDISRHSTKKTCNILGQIDRRLSAGLETDDSVQRVLRGDATSKTNAWTAARWISRDMPIDLTASLTSIDAATYQPRHDESTTSFQQINEPDTAIVSTIPQEEGRGDATQPGLTNIVKLALSLGTIEQLMERLEDAESLAKATETKIFEAKLVENNVKVKEETVETIFDTVLSSIQQLRVDGYQADSRGRRSQAKFKAWRSKVKEEAINLVLQEKQKEQEASRRSIERCKQKMKLLMNERGESVK